MIDFGKSLENSYEYYMDNRVDGYPTYSIWMREVYKIRARVEFHIGRDVWDNYVVCDGYDDEEKATMFKLQFS